MTDPDQIEDRVSTLRSTQTRVESIREVYEVVFNKE